MTETVLSGHGNTVGVAVRLVSNHWSLAAQLGPRSIVDLLYRI